MKHALFIVNSMSGGGAERVCATLANAMCDRGYLVEIITFFDNQTTDYKLKNNIIVHNLKIHDGSKILKFFTIVNAKTKLNKLIDTIEQERGEFDIITSHLQFSNIVTALSAIRNRAIYVMHNTIEYAFGNSFLNTLLFKLLFKNKKVSCVSKGIKKECEKILKNSKVINIYNPFVMPKKCIVTKRPIKENYFIVVGRLCEQKRQDRAIDVFIQGRFNETHKLILCGDGPDRDKLKAKIKKLKMEKYILLYGWTDNILNMIRSADILLLTSDVEGLGMVLIESLAVGTKVVASNCESGPNEILTGELANFLVEPNNIEEYIVKINEALKKYPKINTSYLKPFDVDNIIRRYELLAKEKL